MQPIQVTAKGVEKLLTRLNPRKASGSDGIPTNFLKICAKELSHPLAFVIQQSIHQRAVPNDWREATVTPVFKKGPKTIPANYRPVSLTSVCCKIAEHIIVSQTMSHLETNNLLSIFQHGFRRKRSCETQLLITTHDLASAMNRKSQVDIAVLDFEKAFDKVAHQRLIRKLYHLNLNQDVIGWIHSFLSRRTQRVVVDSYSSDSAPVTSGVPQGTVVGPMLFLIYIDDITEGITSSVRLFADDCLLYREIRSHEDTVTLQRDLDQLHAWSSRWQMNFNIKKCNIMSVTNKRKNAIKTTYSMNGQPFDRVDTIEYLGVSLSNKLTWNAHINKITGNAKRTLGFLRRTLQHTNQTIRLNTYRTLVRPKLEYAATIWDPHHATQINQLEKVQKTAARYIMGKPARKSPNQESASQMVKHLKLDSLLERRRQARCTMMFKLTRNLIAVPATYHPQKMQQHQNTRRSATFFQVHQPTVDCYKFSFIPRTIVDWNSLPVSVTSTETLEAFKSALQKSTL